MAKKKLTKKDKAMIVNYSLEVLQLKAAFQQIAMDRTKLMDDRTRFFVIGRAIIGHFQDYFNIGLSHAANQIMQSGEESSNGKA